MLYLFRIIEWNFQKCLYTEKTKRLKEAKEEAQAEIENFRREREKAFQVYQSEVRKLCYLYVQ